MGNQQSSSASSSQSHSNPSSSSHRNNSSSHHSKSDSSHSGKAGRTRGASQSHYRLFHGASASSSSSNTTAAAAAAGGTHSDNSSAYDYYTLTPSTSLTPSVTRVEAQYHYDHKHGSSLDSYTAGEQRQQPPSTVSPGSDPSSYSGPATATAQAIFANMGAASSAEKLPKRGPRDRTDSASPHSTPVAVPTRTKSQTQREGAGRRDSPGLFRPSGPPPHEAAARERESVSSVSSSYAGAQPIYTHPPRLPLPIQEEVLAPGSPVIGAEGFGAFDNGHLPGFEHELDLDESLPHNRSLLSQTTADEDEDDEERGPYVDPGTGGVSANVRQRTVPTEIIWREEGEKVYVTGTFANWSKKFRMTRDNDGTGIARCTLDLGPGTHHVRFIVDGEMHLSNDLPTAVDYTNTLVNYIEVSADAAYRHDRKHGASAGAIDEGGPPPENLHPPLVLPPPPTSSSSGISGFDHQLGRSRGSLHGHGYDAAGRSQSKKRSGASGPELMKLSPRHYGQTIPQYLVDLDRDEKTARFARAQARVDQMAPPPTLPGFLSKSVLNMTTPTKDDSSILHKPNHTMLNHLATSSIRQGVLATSLTTRYKRKYVTWITYRPTSTDD